MPWPEYVTLQFELINRFTTEECNYYGPLNALLNNLFPASDRYSITPQYKHIAGSIDYTITYIITRRQIPVLFIEVKTYVAYDKDSARRDADVQMRERFFDFTCAGNLPIPKLYGLSILGTRFCVYEYALEDRRLTPQWIAPHPELFTDTAPMERWHYDILEAQGEARLREVVEDIKAMVANLHHNCKSFVLSFYLT
jgi:hypothetical protein